MKPTKRRAKPEATAPARIPQPRKWNAGQRGADRSIRDYDIVFLLGPAGCGKTHIAVELAMKLGTSRIIVSRPMVACGGEDIGFLPGGVEEKLAPWIMPFADVLRTICGPVEAEKELERFEGLPLAFARGRTFDDAIAILDEAQNADHGQIHTFLTRIGLGGKIFVCGDPTQSDRPGGGESLVKIAEALEAEGAASVVYFDEKEIQRHPLIPAINRAMAR